MAKGGKKAKGNAAPAAPPKCTCEHPYNCDCGNRPPRPSRGHKWDPETQQWGGKGHKQKGASGQTTVVGQKANTTEIGKTQVAQWQRLPSQLLQEVCQRQKRPPPKFKELKDGKVRCIVPDSKDSEKDLILIPAHAVANPEQAKEESALLALLQLTPNLPHERKLPEPYKTTWLTAIEAIKNKNNENSGGSGSGNGKGKVSNNPNTASNTSTSNNNNNNNNNNNKIDGSAATSNTNLVLGTTHISAADKRKQQEEKRRQMNARIRKHEAIRMANRDHPVFLSAKLRQQIQQLLKGDTITLMDDDNENYSEINNGNNDDPAQEEGNELQVDYDSDKQAYVVERLHQEGFTKRQARTAFDKVEQKVSNSNNNNIKDDEDQWEQLYDECLQWLCIHLDENQLPEGFDPRGTTLEVVAGKKTNTTTATTTSATNTAKDSTKTNTTATTTETTALSKEGQELAKLYGLNKADAAWLCNNNNKGNDVEEALWSRLCKLADFSPNNNGTTSQIEANQQLIQEEMEALEAIFPSDCTMTKIGSGSNSNNGTMSKIVLNTPEGLTLTTIIDTAKYPTTSIPSRVLISGNNWPKSPSIGVGFHVQLIKFLASMTPGEPMIFEIYSQMQELLQTAPDEIPIITLSSESESSPSLQTGKNVSSSSSSSSSYSGMKNSESSKKSNQSKTSTSSTTRGGGPMKTKRPRQRNVFWSIPPSDTPPAIPFNTISKTIESQRNSLPAKGARSDFISKLRAAEKDSRVMLVTGDTGCGKTTQIPQFILEEAPKTSKIVVAQPRRIAATGVATRVAEERGETKPGTGSVGYVVRGDSAISKDTRLLFCTFGILLRQLQCEGALDCITHIIIDEVHERNLDGDVLMALLKELLTTNKNLTVVLMSATLDADRFATYWGNNTPRMHIPGRTFPVEDYMLEDVLDLTLYNPPKKRKFNRGFGSQNDSRPKKSSPWNDSELSDDDDDGDDGDDDETDQNKKSSQAPANQVPMEERVRRVEQVNIDYDLLGMLVKQLIQKKLMGKDGSILVFLPGAPEINQAKTVVGKVCSGLPIHILPLHGGLQAREQNAVFLPSTNAVKVVLSTNVAETSITIPDCTIVIDTCREKQSSYDPVNRMPLLVEQFASKASLKQRRGRAGRVREGKCYKLISRSTFSKLQEHTAPEITRVALEQTLLSLLFLGVERGNGAFLRTLLDPPSQISVDAAVLSLDKVGAIQRLQENELRLTPLGMHLAGIPAPPVIGKMLVMGSILGCRTAALAMAAVMSTGRSPFLRVDTPRSAGKNNGEETIEQMKQRLILEERAKIFEQVGNSDHVLLAAVFMNWSSLPAGGGGRKKYCDKLGLSFNGMKDILQLVNQYDSSLCAAGFTATAESERNQHSWRILRTCSISALAPSQLVRVQRPSTKYAGTAEGAREKDGVAKEFKFFIRSGGDETKSSSDIRNNEERVFIHPSSALFTVGSYSCPWLVYHSMVKTSKPFLRDATECSAYALLLFGGSLDVEARNNTIVVDGWVKLSANARIGALIRGLRDKMDDLFESKIKDPSMNISTSSEMGLIAKLLATDGLGV